MLNQIAFFGAIETGLIYALVAFSIYLSFRVLDFPDLTVEGTFPLGGAVAISLIYYQNWNPWAATAAAFAAAFAAGALTGFLNVRLKIMNLLAGILVMYALYSVNLRIMGRPNLPVGSKDTVLTPLYNLGLSFYQVPVILFTAVVAVMTILLWLFMKSETGLAMRATGANAGMARAQGIATGIMIILGIAIANGLVGLAGALFAQSRQAADVTLGTGVLVAGLASLIGGEAILSPKTVLRALIACIIGSILFRLVIAVALASGGSGKWFTLQPGDINIITTVIMIAAIKFNSIRAVAGKIRGQK